MKPGAGAVDLPKPPQKLYSHNIMTFYIWQEEG